MNNHKILLFFLLLISMNPFSLWAQRPFETQNTNTFSSVMVKQIASVKASSVGDITFEFLDNLLNQAINVSLLENQYSLKQYKQMQYLVHLIKSLIDQGYLKKKLSLLAQQYWSDQLDYLLLRSQSKTVLLAYRYPLNVEKQIHKMNEQRIYWQKHHKDPQVYCDFLVLFIQLQMLQEKAFPSQVFLISLKIQQQLRELTSLDGYENNRNWLILNLYWSVFSGAYGATNGLKDGQQLKNKKLAFWQRWFCELCLAQLQYHLLYFHKSYALLSQAYKKYPKNKLTLGLIALIKQGRTWSDR